VWIRFDKGLGGARKAGRPIQIDRVFD